MPISRNCPVGTAICPQKYSPGAAVGRPVTSGMPCGSKMPSISGINRTKIGAETGRENDRVEWITCGIRKHGAIGREARDAAAQLDGAIPDPRQRANVDQRHAAVLLDHPARSLGRTPQTEFFEITEREPQHRRIDGIDKTRRQPLVQDRP